MIEYWKELGKIGKIIHVFAVIFFFSMAILMGVILIEDTYYRTPMEIQIGSQGEITGIYFPPFKKVILPKSYPNTGHFVTTADRNWQKIWLGYVIKEQANPNRFLGPRAAFATLPDRTKIPWGRYIQAHPLVLN
jgi:hypothetical protein